MTPLKQSFPPLIHADSEILILGTLPGEDSLRFQQYYGHPRNQFWRLIGDLLQQPLTDYDYADRCQLLLSHRLALWDTLSHASRKGSLDSNIKNPQYNDIISLLENHPAIHTIGFNGKQAQRFFNVGCKAHNTPPTLPQTLIALPSSSPAYTLPYEEKRKQWQALFYH